jgi:three-Cys-motif partner protein
MESTDLYQGREQTLVKHFILRQYLERFAHIVGTHWGSITYVDCFAGPWNARSQELEDSSFAIALDELRKARETHAERGKHLKLRCLFLEQDSEAFGHLQRFASQVKDAEIKVANQPFEDSVGDILEFIRRGGSTTFPFLFIDPMGWTGFTFKTISPLFMLRPGELLINFMTGHIRRFLNQEQSQKSFEDLFGSSSFKSRIEGLSGLDREDAAVTEYLGNVQRTGAFDYACAATVLHPEINRTHFNLLYLTRHIKGVEVFKQTEKRAMPMQETVRAAAQKRRREERSHQSELFSAQDSPESRHYTELRDRYLRQAKGKVLGLLREIRRLPYDQAWMATLSLPLVWESDLKAWIVDWQESKSLRIEGLRERERVPKWGQNHVLVWKGN